MNKNKFTNISEITPDNINIKKYQPYFQIRYNNEIISFLKKKYNIKNPLLIPRIKKIIISSAISNLKHNQEIIYKIYNSLYLMTGEKPIYTKASRSISQFKLYQNTVVGVKVILIKQKMYEFLERLTHIYLPNEKSFYGIPYKSINKNTINIGIKDAHIVKEITNYIGMLYFGFTITIITFPHTEKEIVYDLLKNFDLPIRKDI